MQERRDRVVKLFGVDTSLKWIDFELDGEHYSVHFKDSFLRGVNEVSIWKGTGKGYNPVHAKIESAYPAYFKRVRETWLRLSIWLSTR